jgi:hypothetical protein
VNYLKAIFFRSSPGGHIRYLRFVLIFGGVLLACGWRGKGTTGWTMALFVGVSFVVCLCTQGVAVGVFFTFFFLIGLHLGFNELARWRDRTSGRIKCVHL